MTWNNKTQQREKRKIYQSKHQSSRSFVKNGITKRNWHEITERNWQLNVMLFEFKRLQFPIRLAFAMTINKSQGQSLKVCGLNLENPCFSHGQLYVACSRVGRPSALFVLAPDNKTKNIFYHKVLHWRVQPMHKNTWPIKNH